MTVLTGHQIRGVRRALGLSAPRFAAVLGVHQSTLHRWEARADRPVPVEGIPRDVLGALHRRLVHNGLSPEEIRSKGREVSDALVVGGVLLALGLLIAFARGSG